MAVLAIIAVLCLAAGSTNSVDICPSTDFILKRSKAFQSVRLAISESIYSKSSSYYRRHSRDSLLYHSLVNRFNMSTSSEGYSQYLSAVGEMAAESIKYCDSADRSKTSRVQISALIKQFATLLDGKKISEARKTFGSLVCIQEASKRGATSFVPTPELIDFYDVTFMGRRIRGLIFEYLVDDIQSLGFVVDNTGSMGAEIGKVKHIIRSFIRSNSWRPVAYVLGTFNDPVTKNQPAKRYDARKIDDLQKLSDDIEKLKHDGGGDCAEYGMTGILSALTLTTEDSNIIVLTDAPPKDASLKNLVISAANSPQKRNTIHFFISPGCESHNTHHYREVAKQTCGIVINSINDFGVLAQFAQAAKIARSTSASCPARTGYVISSCTSFYSTAFTESIYILFSEFSAPITLTAPGGRRTIITSSGSLASYNTSIPVPGRYSICSSKPFKFDLVSESNIDFLVEDYGTNSDNPIIGQRRKVIVSSTKVTGINNARPVHLRLLSKDGSSLYVSTLKYCKGLFTGYITIPKVPYRYELQGYDYKGYLFSGKSYSLHKPASSATIAPTISTCPCQNGGSCVVSYRSGVRRVSCNCKKGYGGSVCQTRLFDLEYDGDAYIGFY